MTTSELLNALVTEMAAKKGYAYTTGYLQSMLMQTLSNSTMSKREQEANRSDLQYTLDRLLAETA
jgi:hypothetical protein